VIGPENQLSPPVSVRHEGNDAARDGDSVDPDRAGTVHRREEHAQERRRRNVLKHQPVGDLTGKQTNPLRRVVAAVFRRNHPVPTEFAVPECIR
jgi:hypothetical protein